MSGYQPLNQLEVHELVAFDFDNTGQRNDILRCFVEGNPKVDYDLAGGTSIILAKDQANLLRDTADALGARYEITDVVSPSQVDPEEVAEFRRSCAITSRDQWKQLAALAQQMQQL